MIASSCRFPQGFNPCCSGIPLRIDQHARGGKGLSLGFNPCCSGIPLRIDIQERLADISQGVSILVVVEYL